MHQRSWGIKDLTNRILDKDELYIHYCKERDILKKRFIFLKFKSCFLAKHRLMQQNGHGLQVQGKIHGWIDNNIDLLYKNQLKD